MSGKTRRSGSSLEELLAYQIKVCGLPKPEREYKFLEDRKFRADFAWPIVRIRMLDGTEKKYAIWLIVEVQGGLWLRKGAHSSGVGIKRDYEKSNLAQLAGWTYLQFSGDAIKSGVAVTVIESFIKERMEWTSSTGS